MRRFVIFLAVVAFCGSTYGQTLLFSENFELTSTPDSIAYTGTGVWGKTSILFSEGLRSDSMRIVNSGDSVVMTTDAFSTTGNSFVMLYFDHICKIEFFDEGFIEVSNDNGVTWVRLSDNEYQGAGQFGIHGNKFSAATYPLWDPGTASVPQQSWWQNEVFDISLLVGNAANVKVRFVLRDANPGSTMPDNYAWFIDNIRVIGAFSELNPPVITMLPPIPQDTMYTSDPYLVRAEITDFSGVDTAYVVYTLNLGIPDTIGMVEVQPDIFEANIPFFGFGRTIHYKVVAIDGSAAQNIAYDPTSGTRMIYSKYSPGGTVQIGTGTSSSATVGPTYISSATSTYLWSNHISMFTPAEIGFTGALSQISWEKMNTNGYNLNNGIFRIYLKHTTQSALVTSSGTFATELVGATLVYEDLAANLPLTTGWVDFILPNPNAFVYDGTSNLMVMVYWHRPGNATGAVNWSWTSAPGRAVTWSSNADPPTITYGNGSRPNIIMTFVTPSNLTDDAGIGEIVNPTGGVVANAPFDVVARVMNYGTDTLSSATVNWELNGVLQTPYSWTGSVLQDSLSTDITLGTLTLPLGVHEIKIWTDDPNGVPDMNYGNDTMVINFMACASLLSGTYTIGGTGADFTDFNSAIIALDQCGINGPVTFNVATGTYNEQLTVPFISGASAANPVVFQSATGDSTDVVLQFASLGSSANYTLKFDGPSHVTFQKLTIEALSSQYGRVVDISGNTSDITIANSVLIGDSNAIKTPLGDLAVIYSAENPNHNITITGNHIVGGEHGIWMSGSPGATMDNAMILNNLIEGQTSTSITLRENGSPAVHHNQILITNNVDAFRGIYLVNSNGAISVMGNNVVIHDAISAHGIELSGCVSDSLSHGLVANNMVSQMITISSANNMYPCGIIAYNSTNQRIYHNSVNIYGSSSIANAAFRMFNNGSHQGIHLLNNNFVNQVTGGVVMNFEGVTPASFTSDYNNLYADDGPTAYLTSNHVDLAAWQSVSGHDLNSFAIIPYFNANTDLHTFNGMLNGLATPVPDVTVDIDGDPRDPVNPDPGADEFDPPAIDLALMQIVAPTGGCQMTNAEAVTLLLKNVGTDTIIGGMTANYLFNGGPTVVTETIGSTIFPGDTLFYTFTATVDMDVYALGTADTFDLYAWTTLVGDFVPYNDSQYVELPSLYTPLPPSVTDDTIIYAATATLFALSPDTVMWYQYDTSTVELHQGATYTTPPLFGNTTYWVASTTGSVQSTGPYTPGTNIGPLATVSASNCSTGPCSAFNDGNLGNCGTQLVWVSTSSPPAAAPHVNWIDYEWVAPVTIDGMTIHHAQTTARFLTGADLYYWDAGAWVYFHTFSNLPMQCENIVPFPLVTTTKLRITSFQMTGTGQTSNPNFREIEVHEGQALGCESPRVPVTVFVGPPPPNDAGIIQVLSPAGSVPSGYPTQVTVELKNYGTANLQSASIYYALNGVLQDSLHWTGNLLQDSTEILTIDTIILGGGLYCLDAWTAMPNGVVDIILLNDTSQSCFNACLSGVYSIGPASGTYDYNTFNDALDALDLAGICGHVVFEVHPGTYTEQLTISAITGMDANNTVTFRGATLDSTDVTLQYAAIAAADNWVVQLNGAEYFSFEYLTVKATGLSNGRVFDFMNKANHNAIHHCVIETSTTSTSSTFAGLYSTSNTSSDYNVFTHNRFIGGYYSVYWYATAATQKTHFTFTHNILEDFHYYGLYVYRTDSMFIHSNKLTNRVTSGITYGMYLYYSRGYSEVMKNEVRLRGTSSQYGITVGYQQNSIPVPIVVANNFVSQEVSTGTVYGIYLIGANYVDLYFNSVNVTGGSVTGGRALYQSTGSNINIKNNIFNNSGGGYAYYINTPTAISSSDYNNYYVTGSNFAYWNTAHSSLAALQTANSDDVNSHDIDPPYTSLTDLRLTNNNLSALGTSIPAIVDDIDGKYRSPLPTIGAHELPLVPTDAGIVAIYSPGVSTNEGYMYPVEVQVRNWGTDPINGGLTIEYSVNGATPVSYLYNDTIPPFDTANVILPSMTSPAGQSLICVWTALPGDTNFFNDEHCKSFFGIPVHDAAVTEAMGPESGCDLGMDTVWIRVTNLGVDTINAPSPSTVTVSYQLNGMPPVVTETFTPILVPGDTIYYQFNTLADFSVTTTTDTFHVAAWIDLAGDNVLYNDTAYFEVISQHTPAPPVVSDTTIPYGTWVTLHAQSPDSILWFAQDTATIELAGGPYYTTPVLYNNTTYWAQAGTGTGSLVPADITTTFVAGNGQAGNMFDIIAHNTITIDSFDVNCTQSALMEVWYRQGTYIGHTASQAGWTKLGDYNVTTSGTGFPTRLPIGGLTIPAGETYGIYVTYPVGSGIQYTNGNGSNEIYTNADMTIEAYHGGAYFSLTFTPRVWNGTIYYSVGDPDGGCASTRVPLNVTVSGQAPCDAGVSRLLAPVSAVNMTSQEQVQVKVTNYGTDPQSNIPVHYQFDNQPVVTETITATVPANDSITYSFATLANLGNVGHTYQLKTWTGLLCDTVPQNDTLQKSITNLAPNYCQSSATLSSNTEITNVTIGTSLNNNSPANGAMYTDFSGTVVPPMISPGVNYSMSVTSSYAPGSSSNSTCYVKVWIDLDRNGIFDPVTELVFEQATTSNNTVTAPIQIPTTALIGNTIMRVVLQVGTNPVLVTPCNTYSQGETEDYLISIAPQASCDAGVVQIISPQSLNASATPIPVWVRFANFGSDPIPAGNLSVAYELNNGAPVTVVYNSVLPPNGVDSIQMPDVTLPMGNNTLCAYTILACDSNSFNDNICRGAYGQYKTTLPFADDFEGGNLWYKPAASTNWQFGTPAGTIINTAQSPVNVWMTNLTGQYSNNADESVYTPLFDFSGLSGQDTVTLSFYHWMAVQSGDYGRVQYSTNAGQSWANLGFFGDASGTNWYNTTSGGLHYFSHTNSGWMQSSYKLSPNTFNGQSDVQFRFNFVSTASGQSDGWAIDNFELGLPISADDVGVVAIVTPVGDTAAGSPVHATVTIRNFGTNTQTMIPLEVFVDNVSVGTETWTGSLAQNATVNYTFVVPFTAPTTNYQLCVRTNLPGDAFPQNDQHCRSYNALPAYHDVGISQILLPEDSAGLLCFYSAQTQPWYQYPVEVRLHNYGQNTQSSIPLSYTFQNGGTVHTETWTGTLAAGTSIDVQLNTLFMPNPGVQQVCVETTLLGDPITANNEACRTYTGVACIGVDGPDPDSFLLMQNIPNPATHTTLIGYQVPQAGKITFGVINLVGQELHTMHHTAAAGFNQIDFDVSDLASGIYYYYVEYNGQRLTHKMVIRK